MKPKYYIGPMSKNIVDSIIEFCNETNYKIGLLGSGFEKSAGIRTRLKVQGENAQTNLSGTVELYGIL